MSDSPFFTVVSAAFNRGLHIVPTIQSVLEQTFSDFEFLVVGDGVMDDTLDHVPLNDPRVGIIALPWNSGSQARPNNVGIAAARGHHIAYLGHDDIWMPDHLAALAHCLATTSCDVAVSGCAFHGPPSTDMIQITGLFNNPEDPGKHFFPPSSFAHRLPVVSAIGGWRTPLATVAPVDADFLLRAWEAGLSFRSTGRVTAHKFAAGHRYLSYLEPSSVEQRDMLEAIRGGTADRRYCEELVERARSAGTFMIHEYPDFSGLTPGAIFLGNRSNKGIDRAITRPLVEKTYVAQSMEPRGLDWYPAEQGFGGPFRWSGPSLHPKLLVPFNGNHVVRITLHLLNHDPAGIIDDIRLIFNGQAAEHRTTQAHPAQIDLEFIGELRAIRQSILELILPRAFCPAASLGTPDRRQLGIILTGFTIEPEVAC